MSLLSLLQEKRKCLIKSTTTVTTVSGRKYKETLNDGGESRIEEISERHAGYIVDNNPDLQVAEILPYLSLGSQDVAFDRELLLKHNITHILSLGVDVKIQFPEFDYKFIDLYDTPDENILNVLPTTNELIKAVKSYGSSKIFVHCNAGCSRAPSVVIGYLIRNYNLTYSAAYDSIRRMRYIRPNAGFEEQLKRYELSK